MAWRMVAVLATLFVATSRFASAQSELQGRVLTDSARRPISNAQIAIPRLNVAAATDSLGRYRLERIPRGEHVVITRAVGYRPDSTATVFDGDETLVNDVVLKVALNELPTVAVRARTKPVPFGSMAAFEERRAQGMGSFLDRDILAKNEHRRLAEVLASNVPGLTVHRGGGSRAWAATARNASTAKCALCPVRKRDILDMTDMAAGAPMACYSDVYLDGVIVYNSVMGSPSRNGRSTAPAPLFDLNSINPAEVEAIEVYTSAAQIPAQYNKTSGGCGVILIWSRTGR
jgi:CarboxypepD_reg-like domain/TonB-dependent Receptor Plug Domain